MCILNFPVLVFVVCFAGLWLALRAGRNLSKRRRPMEKDEREYFTIVLTAALTLLGLIIGFTFSMAVGRYDLRKEYEDEEANAIGTEYVRAGLFPAEDSAKIRELLKKYLALRVSFYTVSNTTPGGRSKLRQISRETEQLQKQLWSLVENSAAPRNATMALVASGMNDVLNLQGHAQAARWNRVPNGAWILMLVIAFSCSLLMGFGAGNTRIPLQLVLPIVLSVAFFLVADIDSPRGGVIRVPPENLLSLSESLNTR
jgi:hypothetical protein